jgi:hypothetical protein
VLPTVKRMSFVFVNKVVAVVGVVVDVAEIISGPDKFVVVVVAPFTAAVFLLRRRLGVLLGRGLLPVAAIWTTVTLLWLGRGGCLLAVAAIWTTVPLRWSVPRRGLLRWWLPVWWAETLRIHMCPFQKKGRACASGGVGLKYTRWGTLVSTVDTLIQVCTFIQ